MASLHGGLPSSWHLLPHKAQRMVQVSGEHSVVTEASSNVKTTSVLSSGTDAFFSGSFSLIILRRVSPFYVCRIESTLNEVRERLAILSFITFCLLVHSDTIILKCHCYGPLFRGSTPCVSCVHYYLPPLCRSRARGSSFCTPLTWISPRSVRFSVYSIFLSSNRIFTASTLQYVATWVCQAVL